MKNTAIYLIGLALIVAVALIITAFNNVGTYNAYDAGVEAMRVKDSLRIEQDKQQLIRLAEFNNLNNN